MRRAFGAFSWGWEVDPIFRVKPLKCRPCTASDNLSDSDSNSDSDPNPNPNPNPKLSDAAQHLQIIRASCPTLSSASELGYSPSFQRHAASGVVHFGEKVKNQRKSCISGGPLRICGTLIREPAIQPQSSCTFPLLFCSKPIQRHKEIRLGQRPITKISISSAVAL